MTVRNIMIEEYKGLSVIDHKVEVVERKGLGHPDTICDSVMNEISVNLSKAYIKELGYIAHHNIDKGLLTSGRVEIKFGGGKVLEPMLMIFGDRATFNADNKDIPVDQIAFDTANDWFKTHLRFVGPENLKYQSQLRPGSAALQDIFKRAAKGEILGANDTSAAVGYAPLTPLEKTVFETEKYLNSEEFLKRFPASGEDIKVMGLRTDGKMRLTIAMAMVDRFIKDENDYFRKKDEILEDVKGFVEKYGNPEILINTLDEKGRGISGLYMTVTGTCAEDADSGEVGRGNRVNGLIPLNRPIGSEAAAGKNPVSHVGKIYNVLTHRIANRIYENVDGIKEVYIWLLSQIGQPIDQPAIAAAQVSANEGVSVSEIEKEIHEQIDAELRNIQEFCMDLAQGKIPVC